MNKVAQVLAVLEALTLIAVGVLEAFFHRSPELYGIFLIEPEEYDAVRLWTVNVGFYNLLMGHRADRGVVLREHDRVVVGRTTIVLTIAALHVCSGSCSSSRSRSSGSRRRRGRAGHRRDPRGHASATGARERMPRRGRGGNAAASRARSDERRHQRSREVAAQSVVTGAASGSDRSRITRCAWSNACCRAFTTFGFAQNSWVAAASPGPADRLRLCSSLRAAAHACRRALATFGIRPERLGCAAAVLAARAGRIV